MLINESLKHLKIIFFPFLPWTSKCPDVNTDLCSVQKKVLEAVTVNKAGPHILKAGRECSDKNVLLKIRHEWK